MKQKTAEQELQLNSEEINELKTKELQSLIQEKVLESEKLLKAKLELQEKFDATLLEVDGLRSEKAELIIKNEEMQRTLANSKEKETELNRSFDELREECLEIEVEVLRKKIEEDKSTKDSYEKEVENLNATLLKERLEREQVKQENSEDTKALKSLQQSLKEENSKLQTKLMSTNEELENLKRQTDEEKAKFEVELSVLNENLTTIRGDLVSNLAALEEANKLNDQLMGGKLGHLSHSGDVLQLCTITTTKVSSRKWADDNEVKECMGCNKSFSVTVRKHHCRNCGNIYCNDCSAKEAKLVSSKKPVRVCDGCFIEIGKM
uniref:Early endosome antigen 1 n=1 Tax=Magallana gigas TaxID=29159 RepID=K1R651_MAGGI